MNNLWIAVLGLLLFSCNNSSENTDEIQKTSVEVGDQNDQNKNETSFANEIEFSKYVTKLFENGDFEKLKPYVNGEILFSPYAYIDVNTARKVNLQELSIANKDVHFWGLKDGTGDSILLTTPDYLEKYVLNLDINQANVKVNSYDDKPKAFGSELHNVQTVIPGSKYVEFYMPPSEQGGMDWKALIYVVSVQNGKYILNAIIHNQWTV